MLTDLTTCLIPKSGKRPPKQRAVFMVEAEVAPSAPGLSPVKMVLGLVVLISLNYVFTDLLDESVRRSSPLCL